MTYHILHILHIITRHVPGWHAAQVHIHKRGMNAAPAGNRPHGGRMPASGHRLGHPATPCPKLQRYPQRALQVDDGVGTLLRMAVRVGMS